MGKTKFPQAKVVDLTPALAAKLAELIPEYQRNVRKPHVANLTDDMNNGRWKFNSNGIGVLVSPSGEHLELVNGMHRVLARLDADPWIRVPVVLVESTENEYGVVDQGKPRNLRDQLKAVDAPYVSALASVIRRVFNHERFDTSSAAVTGGSLASRPQSVSAMMDFYLTEMNLASAVEACRIAGQAYSSFSAPNADIATFLYLADSAGLGDHARKFISLAIEGGGEVGTAPRAYRDLALTWKASRNQVPQKVKWHLLLRSWHYYLAGSEVKMLKMGKKDQPLTIVPDWMEVQS